MRRAPGIQGLQRQQNQQSRLRHVGADLGEQNAAEVRRQLDNLRERIEAFAVQHRTAINQDPQFRANFNEMCAAIGVDPLQSSKGFWVQMLGVGDFYYELAVQVADVCMRSRATTGGLIALAELHLQVANVRSGGKQTVSVSDVKCAINQLQKLGGGYAIVNVGNAEYVRSVPAELNADHAVAMGQARNSARLTHSMLVSQCSWTPARASRVLDSLLKGGLVWVDHQAEAEPEYWIPCIWEARRSGGGPSEV